jgi:RNA recognition motif-containing protein
MEKKLYVGGLSYSTIENTLKEVFSQAGKVESATIITDKLSGRSKGFGFVEMSTTEEAQKAIELFNGKEVDGRTVTVNEARPKESRPREGGFSHGGGYGHERRGGRDRDRRDSRGGGRRERW